MTLYHLTDRARADAIEQNGFTDEDGTYKQTGIDLHGVFFSAAMLDSNEDDAGGVVFAIDLEPLAIETFEILEADSDHRKYSIPAEIANAAPRKRLTHAEAKAIPVVDRANDPAYPFANEA